MPNCCQGATCACKVSAAADGHMVVTGSGSANDPFELSADVALAVQDSLQFDLTLSGTGDSTSPWSLGVGYAPTAKLSNIPDVNAATPSNGQVLGWDDTAKKWVNQAPTSATPGAIQHGASLSGDGSAGSPLMVVPNAARLLANSASGVGLSDNGMNAVVQHFATSSARNSIAPTPVLNTLTMLDTAPGRIDYWNGTSWAPLLSTITVKPVSPALLELSGPYNGVTPITHLLKTVALTADGSGVVTLLDSTDLSGAAGVLDCWFQESGTVPMRVLVSAGSGVIRGTAYRLTDGAAAAGATVTGMIRAYLY